MTDISQTEALVLVSYGAQGVVLLADGERRRCKFRRGVGRPYCGDRVLVARADHASLVVECILPRKNQFVRADERQRQHVIAANLDQVLIVVAVAPPRKGLIETRAIRISTQTLGRNLIISRSQIRCSFLFYFLLSIKKYELKIFPLYLINLAVMIHTIIIGVLF